MWIRDVVVEAGREEHIARHGVTVAGALEEMFGNPPARREHNGYYRCVDQTGGGRYLAVFVVPLGDGYVSLVTARDASTAERRAYRAQRRH